MNPPHENELAAQIDRELKALPPLRAPATLAPRVLAAIAAQQRAPAPRAGWQSWPLVWRVASFAALVALFAGLCFAGWQATQTEAVTTASAKVSGLFALLGLAGKTLGVLGEACLAVVRSIGTGYVIGALVLVGLAYAACAAAGSFYFRFAFARR
jgi:hypothetical protein